MGRVRATALWVGSLAAWATGMACRGTAPDPTASEPNRFPSDVQSILERCPPKDDLVYFNCVLLGPSAELPFVRGPGGDAERLALLADPRPAVRSLVGQVLDHRPCPSEETCGYAAHRELAEQLLAVAESERDARVTRELARPIARIDVKKTGLSERVEGFFARAPDEAAARGLDHWLSFNPDALPSMMRLGDSTKAELSRAALRGMRHGLHGPLRRDVCSVYVRKFGEGVPYDFLAETILFGDRDQDCSPVWDDFFTKAEARLATAFREPAGQRHWLNRLRKRMWETRFRDPAITDAHLSRTLALMVRVSEDRAFDTEARRSALIFAAVHHPHEQAYLERLTSDPDPVIRKEAAEWKKREAQRSYRGRPRHVEPESPAAPAPETRPPVEAPEAPAPKQRSWVELLAALGAGCGVLLLAAFVFLKRRAAMAEPVASVGPVAPVSSAPGPEQASGARPSKRPHCAPHGLATGPDGLCALCRSDQKRAHRRTSAAPGVQSVPLAVLAAAAVALLALGAGWAALRAASGFGRAPDRASASAAAAASSPERVPDTRRAQAREPGVAYPGAPPMLNSPKFSGGQTIPRDYTCDGKNVSPPFTFSNVPMNAKSLALKLVARRTYEGRSPGARRGGPEPEDRTAHFALYNLPPELAGLPEGLSEVPAGASALRARDGSIYSGPCPTGGKVSYEFWLYALDVRLPEQPAGRELDIPEKHAVGITIENGSSDSTRSVTVVVPDLPAELRDKQGLYEVCDSDDRHCDTNPVSTYDRALVFTLPYRNGHTRFWFAEPGEGGHELTPRFRFDPNSPDCVKKDLWSAMECRIGYGFLKP